MARLPRRIVAMALVAVTAPAFALSEEETAPAVRAVADFHRLEKARDAFAAGEWEAALERFRLLARRHGDDPEILYGLSRAAEELGRTEEAIEAGERVEELGYAQGGRLARRLARLHLAAGRKERALDWLERALAAGADGRPGLREDATWEPLHDRARFRQLAGIPPQDLTREEGWRFDLDYLVEEARRLHAGPDRPAFDPGFAAEAERLRRAIPSRSDAANLAGMMQLVARLGDGHSGLYGPPDEGPLDIHRGQLPMRFYRFPEGLFVLEGQGEAARHAGKRVVAFGDLPAEEVFERLKAFRGVDNATTWEWMLPQFYMPSGAFLAEIGATDNPAAVRITFEEADGTTTEETIAATAGPGRRKLRPPATTRPGASAETPLWLRRVEDSYWLEPLPDLRALYFQFNQVRAKEDENLEAFAARLDRTLREGGFRHLIVDVRHNNGGNNTLVRPLVRAIAAWDAGSEARRVWVVTGRNTFSAAQNFINRLESATDATFVGEPSSSSPNFVGESTDLILPWSGIRGSISNQYWQDSQPFDGRKAIRPDVPVALRAEDYFANRDPVLDALRILLAEREAQRGGTPR